MGGYTHRRGNMETTIVIGLGEVGRPLYEILKSSNTYIVYGYDVRSEISPNKLDELPRDADFLHIAYPYTEHFIEYTRRYVEQLRPKRLTIHSTVLPGTTRLIHEKTGLPTAYSPVRGKHPNLKRHMIFWPKWVSAYPLGDTRIFEEHLVKAGFKVKVAKNPETLELAKLFETAYRAIMIATWQEIHRLSLKYNAELAGIAEFISEVHEVLRDRPVFYPDYIGGHCLIPNTKLLNSIDPNSIWRFVVESNDKRFEELKDEKVRKDLEEVKKISMMLFPKWYFE
jgi:UDP-N-acetyl-D-mannosaminuronate dehydrogenase